MLNQRIKDSNETSNKLKPVRVVSFILSETSYLNIRSQFILRVLLTFLGFTT